VSTDVRPPLPLDEARLCLDCDILTDTPTCPACDRVQTFPLALWLIPLEAAAIRPWGAAEGGPRPTRPEPRSSPPWPAGSASEPRPGWLIVVRAGDWELYDYLRRRFEALPDVSVILDRRKRERRGPRDAVAPRDRRSRQRRRVASPEEQDWWETAGFRIAARAPAFSVYAAPAHAAPAPPGARR
jgi:hypothetical protein